MIFIVIYMCLFGQYLYESREKRILVSQIPVHIKCGSKLVSPIWITVLSKTVCTFWLHFIQTAKWPCAPISHIFLLELSSLICAAPIPL